METRSGLWVPSARSGGKPSGGGVGGPQAGVGRARGGVEVEAVPVLPSLAAAQREVAARIARLEREAREAEVRAKKIRRKRERLARRRQRAQ